MSEENQTDEINNDSDQINNDSDQENNDSDQENNDSLNNQSDNNDAEDNDAEDDAEDNANLAKKLAKAAKKAAKEREKAELIKAAEDRANKNKSKAERDAIEQQKTDKLLKIGKVTNEISNIISTANNTRKPISAANLNKIIFAANKYKILLMNEVISAFNREENRDNVLVVITYFEQRIIDFFNSQKLLPASSDDPLFNVILLNLCIQVKQRNFKFVDDILKNRNLIIDFFNSQSDKLPEINDPAFKIKFNEKINNIKLNNQRRLKFLNDLIDYTQIDKQKLFLDVNCFIEACKLYVWNVKLNECSPLNRMSQDEFDKVYVPNIERKCNIANVQIKLASPPLIPGIEDDSGDPSKQLANDEDDDDNKTSNIRKKKGNRQSGDEQSEDEQSEDEQSANEQSANEQSSNEQSANEQSADEQSANEQSADEQSVDEQSTDESNKDSNNLEQFNQYNLDFFKKYNGDDYIYFILIALLLISLFFIYLRYK